MLTLQNFCSVLFWQFRYRTSEHCSLKYMQITLRAAAGHFLQCPSGFGGGMGNERLFPSRHLKNGEIWENMMPSKNSNIFWELNRKVFMSGEFLFLQCCGVLSQGCVKVRTVPVHHKGQLSYLVLWARITCLVDAVLDPSLRQQILRLQDFIQLCCIYMLLKA